VTPPATNKVTPTIVPAGFRQISIGLDREINTEPVGASDVNAQPLLVDGESSHQDSEVSVESGRKPQGSQQTQVALSSLDITDVGEVQTCPLCQFQLAEPELHSLLTNAAAELRCR